MTEKIFLNKEIEGDIRGSPNFSRLVIVKADSSEWDKKCRSLENVCPTKCAYTSFLKLEPVFTAFIPSLKNLLLVITFSIFSFESFLVDIICYMFLWLCIWFCFHSHSQDQSLNGPFANTLPNKSDVNFRKFCLKFTAPLKNSL